MFTVEDAARVAEELVAPLGRRWSHVKGVASRARTLLPAVPAGDGDLLLSAAWLHDIGYAPEIGHTRFHPLDGARYLHKHGWPADVVNLVAHHSGARFEAAERGLSSELAYFPFSNSPVLDALVTADLTTGPAGEPLTYDERIAEILHRYPAGSPVRRTWIKASPILKESVARTNSRLSDQPK
ncbi:metal dependent phosphohydrolase [Amycolatopsis sulphurea]|uniref:Metal dependent phosphohydrolase n=1 Tax=Amycolatopsis sulphurea TaxID=76022 RepID=A0A2A9G181_9PSEU|nr:HD domain-containing protein [Amycolatopsis sulphurea]PFG56923.1 metal dependent phosphohydrolase [Amycolatopsis sulphurea]